MEFVDLTQPWDDDCPSWPTYPHPKTYYIKRKTDDRVNSQYLEIPNHNGTHIDGERHFVTSGKAIGEEPIDDLITPGAVVDISDSVEDFYLFSKDDILEQGVEIKRGDGLFIHTGYKKYAYHKPDADIERFFLKHPAPAFEFAEWCKEMEFTYIGIDVPSLDQPMNGAAREIRPDIANQAEEYYGEDLDALFPSENYQIMHNELLKNGILIVENIAGEIDSVLNQRLLLGCFPWRMIDVESSPCRVVGFMDPSAESNSPP